MKKLLKLSLVLFLLTSCYKKREIEDEKWMVKGEWLISLFEEFGMSSVEKNDISWIDKESPYYDSIMTGIEWNVIQNQIEVDEILDYRFLIMTLYRTMYIDTVLSLNEMYNDLKEKEVISIKEKQLGDKVLEAKALQILEKALGYYRSSHAYQSHFSMKEKEEVQEINDYYYVDTSKIVISNVDISENEIILIDGKYYRVIEKVKEEANTYHIEEASYDDLVEELQLEESFYPDLTKVTFEEGVSTSPTTYQMVSPFGNDTSSTVVQTAIKYLDYNIGDLKITGHVAKNNIRFKVTGKVHEDLKLAEELTLSNLQISTKLDMNRQVIKHGLLQIDYETKNTISLSTEKYVDTSKLKIKDLTTLKEVFNKQVFSNSDEVNKSFDLLTLHIPVPASHNLVIVQLVVGLNISAKGQVSLQVRSKQSKGIEIINNKIRFINKDSKDIDPLIEGGIEASVFLKTYVTCLKQKILNVAINAGVKAKASLTLHYVDLGLKEVEKIKVNDYGVYDVPAYEVLTENQFYDTCLDVSISWLLGISAGEKGTLLHKLGLSYSYDFFKNKDPVISIIHIENHKTLKECQRVYQFYEMDNQSRQLPISSYREILSLNQSKQLTIDYLSEGYSDDDLIWNSSNPSIVSVNKGYIKALAYGEVIITVKTKDGLYIGECFVSVSEENDVRSVRASFFHSYYFISYI